MKILVLGRIPSAHFMSMLLAKSNTVYHYGANISYQVTDNYIPIPTKETYGYLIGCIDKIDFDLIVPMQIEYQMSHELREAIDKKNIPCFMPSYENTMLEWDRVKTKTMLDELNIPTPKYSVMNKDELLSKFTTLPRPFVLKCNMFWNEGAQTVIVTDDNYQAELVKCKDNNDVDTYVIDEYITGNEISYHAVCNGSEFVYIGSARDYKKFENGDKGFNTEGIGSYSNSDRFYIVDQYAQKIVDYLSQKGTPYVGILYLGIIIDKDNVPFVLEINTRFGCPESLAILSTIITDMSTVMYNAAIGKKIPEITFTDSKAVTVMVVPKDYQYDPDANKPIFNDIPVDIVYNRPGYSSCHAFTVTGSTVDEASKKLYSYLDSQSMGDYVYRTDIGFMK
jgi:phosphoribosylamine-glycine ligase